MLLNIKALFFTEVLFLLMRFALMGPKITLKDISFLLFKGFFSSPFGLDIKDKEKYFNSKSFYN